MSDEAKGITQKELGERLRKAREAVGLTQASAAAEIDMARTTIVAIEQGNRRVRMDELQSLARVYKTSANSLLRQEAVHVDLSPQFRKLSASSADAEVAAQLLADLSKAEVELENLLGVAKATHYPPERPIGPGDIRLQAEQDALELRQRLGLAQAPVQDIVTLLELDLGIRVFLRRLPGNISGLFAYDDAIGACILLNANHPKTRRTQSAAHELGHFVSQRRRPEILTLDQVDNSREERYATAFGRAFVTPARAVIQKFQEVTSGASHLTRRHVIMLAHYFGVSREAMVRRLEELSLTKSGTWEWFQKNGGITDEQERQVLGDLAAQDRAGPEANRPTTLRLAMLAEQAWRRDLLSEGQLARLLKLDRVQLRELLDGFDMEGDSADEPPRLAR